MKENEDQRLEAVKAAIAATLAAQKKQAFQSVVLCLLLLFVIFGLPRMVPASFGPVIMTVGGAAWFSVQLYLCPVLFRSRSGSLKPAFGMLAFMWLVAADASLATLLKWIH